MTETPRQTFRLDHVVILVIDLAAAMAQYSALGFTVVTGGEHEGGLTHNALIAFSDGSYLELLSFKQPITREAGSVPATSAEAAGETAPSDLSARFQHRRMLVEGIVDFALASQSLADQIVLAKGRGLNLAGPVAGGRTRPDGRRLRWLTAFPATFDLPFLIQDETDRKLRVPHSIDSEHQNGANGIISVSIAVEDLGASVTRYDALLGSENRRAPDECSSSEGVRAIYQLDDTEIILTPYGKTDDVGVGFGHNTGRPFSVSIVTDDPDRIGLLAVPASAPASGGHIMLTHLRGT